MKPKKICQKLFQLHFIVETLITYFAKFILLLCTAIEMKDYFKTGILTVSDSIGPYFMNFSKCIMTYFDNGITNVGHQVFNCLWLVDITLFFNAHLNFQKTGQKTTICYFHQLIVYGSLEGNLRVILWCFLFCKEYVTLLQAALKKLLTSPVIM